MSISRDLVSQRTFQDVSIYFIISLDAHIENIIRLICNAVRVYIPRVWKDLARIILPRPFNSY